MKNTFFKTQCKRYNQKFKILQFLSCFKNQKYFKLEHIVFIMGLRGKKRLKNSTFSLISFQHNQKIIKVLYKRTIFKLCFLKFALKDRRNLAVGTWFSKTFLRKLDLQQSKLLKIYSSEIWKPNISCYLMSWTSPWTLNFRKKTSIWIFWEIFILNLTFSMHFTPRFVL